MAPRKNYDSAGNDSHGEGRSRSDSGSKRGATAKDSDDYKKRRERNNIAVRKSRQLSRMKAKVTQEKVTQLREENQKLEQKVQILSKELSVLRDLFLSSADASTTGSHSGNVDPFQGNFDTFLSEVDKKETLQIDHKYSSVD